jgi:kynurenine formamidase
MQAVGRSSALSDDGRTLKPGYRITIADLEDTLEWEGLRRGIQPGDAVVIRTGWTSYLQEGPPYATYLGPVPGPWVAEAHWLADHRPALVASDTYAMEVFPGPGPALGRLAEAHQVLMVANGIRIGEGFNSAELAADRVYEFLFIDTPYNLHGATCAGNAPAAIGVPRRGRR